MSRQKNKTGYLIPYNDGEKGLKWKMGEVVYKNHFISSFDMKNTLIGPRWCFILHLSSFLLLCCHI